MHFKGWEKSKNTGFVTAWSMIFCSSCTCAPILLIWAAIDNLIAFFYIKKKPILSEMVFDNEVRKCGPTYRGTRCNAGSVCGTPFVSLPLWFPTSFSFEASKICSLLKDTCTLKTSNRFFPGCKKSWEMPWAKQTKQDIFLRQSLRMNTKPDGFFFAVYLLRNR